MGNCEGTKYNQARVQEQRPGEARVQSSTSSPFLVSAATASLALLDACKKNENYFYLVCYFKYKQETIELKCLLLKGKAS